MIRHGQASYGAEDYDNLSQMGKQQCYWLGAHLQQLGLNQPIMVDGGLKRHLQSCIELTKSLNIQSQHTDSAFAEINISAIFSAYQTKYSDLPDYKNNRKFLNAALRMVLTAWFEARIIAGDETWLQYTKRINDGLTRLMQLEGRILLVTSGGAIAAAVGNTLKLDAAAQVAIFTKIYNSSVTKLIHTQNGIELHSLNNVAHLETADRKESLTYV